MKIVALSDIPLFDALKSKMQWHQSRQGVLAENIAHADTPDYEARDLKEYSFKAELARSVNGLSTSATSRGHIKSAMSSNPAGGRAEGDDSFEITPSGNNVVLEEQMMKVTQNQMDFQAASSLYTKGLGLLRTALSKK